MWKRCYGTKRWDCPGAGQAKIEDNKLSPACAALLHLSIWAIFVPIFGAKSCRGQNCPRSTAAPFDVSIADLGFFSDNLVTLRVQSSIRESRCTRRTWWYVCHSCFSSILRTTILKKRYGNDDRTVKDGWFAKDRFAARLVALRCWTRQKENRRRRRRYSRRRRRRRRMRRRRRRMIRRRRRWRRSEQVLHCWTRQGERGQSWCSRACDDRE